MEKATELGQALIECEEFSVLKAAEAAMDNDEKAQEIIGEFRQVQHAAHEGHLAGEDNADKYLEKMQEVQERMRENSSIAAFLAAQEGFNKILQGVNFIIGKAIGQVDGCDPNSCSTCGGGCN